MTTFLLLNFSCNYNTLKNKNSSIPSVLEESEPVLVYYYNQNETKSQPNIFFKSASGVEIGVRLNLSTSAFRMLGAINAGKLGPI